MTARNIFDFESYREFLQWMLVESQGKNPAYSLRAMANRLRISPSLLSALLTGKKRLSTERAADIALALHFGNDQAEYLSLLVQLRRAHAPKLREQILRRMRYLRPKTPVTPLGGKAFTQLLRWPHIPIRELVSTERAPLTPERIGVRLGIEPKDAERALRQLIKAGHLVEDRPGHYRKTQARPFLASQAANRSLQRFHAQMLRRTIASLPEHSPDERFIGTDTLPLSPDQLPEVRRLAEDFMDRVVELSRDRKQHQEVFHLGVQFIRLTKTKR